MRVLVPGSDEHVARMDRSRDRAANLPVDLVVSPGRILVAAGYKLPPGTRFRADPSDADRLLARGSARRA